MAKQIDSVTSPPFLDGGPRGDRSWRQYAACQTRWGLIDADDFTGDGAQRARAAHFCIAHCLARTPCYADAHRTAKAGGYAERTVQAGVTWRGRVHITAAPELGLQARARRPSNVGCRACAEGHREVDFTTGDSLAGAGGAAEDSLYVLMSEIPSGVKAS